MADFTSLSRLKVDGKSTAEFTFYDLPGEPTMICRPATKQNSEYFKSIITDPEMRKFLRKGSNDDTKVNAKIAEIYARHIIADWRDMDELVEDKKDAKPTIENKKDFVVSLLSNAEWVWEKFTQFVNDDSNFVQPDVEEVVKN